MTSPAASAESPRDESAPSPRANRIRHFIAAVLGFVAFATLVQTTVAVGGPVGPLGTIIAGVIVLGVGAFALVRRRRIGFVVSPQGRPYLVTGALGFCLALWLGTIAVGLAIASIQTWTFFGAEPSPESIERAGTYLRNTFAASTAAALPGLAIAGWQRRPGWFAVFAVLAVAMLIALLITLIT